jgi:hypothetical protein
MTGIFSPSLIPDQRRRPKTQNPSGRAVCAWTFVSTRPTAFATIAKNHDDDEQKLSSTSPYYYRYDEELRRRGRRASVQQHVLLRLVALIIGKKDGIIGKKDTRQEEWCWII